MDKITRDVVRKFQSIKSEDAISAINRGVVFVSGAGILYYLYEYPLDFVVTCIEYAPIAGEPLALGLYLTLFTSSVVAIGASCTGYDLFTDN
jgi:hypothetical protein